MLLKKSDPFVELLDEGQRSFWTILCNVVRDFEQVALRNGKIPERMLSGHEFGGGVWPSSVCA
ncbi:MAG: hypothetical protein HBSIN02_07730 [Bacteroidia bacterium]|nr:MAG: hypothetical protein HBSIN02_07730 [Bacteroidia bacterium]